jgi:hypothetical protein
MLLIEPDVESRPLLLSELSELLCLLCLESFESFELFVDPFKLPFAGEFDSFELRLLPLTFSEAREILARLRSVNMIISPCSAIMLTSL